MSAAEVTSAHGTNGEYQRGCRCLECRDAWNRYMREYRARQTVGAYVFRSRPKYGRPTAADKIAARVGSDFPALGTTVRALAVMAA